MKEMRRVLALVLCFVMLVGVVPVGALATEAETTAPSETVVETQVTEAAAVVVETTEAAEIETTAAAEEEIVTFDLGTISAEAMGMDDSLDDIDTAMARAKAYIDALTINNSSNDPETVVKTFKTHFTWDNEKRENGRSYLFDWSYYNGVVFEGLEYLYEATGEEVYKDYVVEYMSSMINADGTWATCTNDTSKVCAGYNSTHGADCYKTASLLLDAYEMSGDSRYLTVAATLYADLDTAAKSYSLANAGNNYRHTWASDPSPDLWLDGLYMILPFRAEYAKHIGDTEELDLIVSRMQWVSDNMYNSSKKLFYHAADSASSNSGTYWLRSIGWYAAAIVDIMDSMEGENLEAMKAQLVKLVDGMIACQNEYGMWLNNMAASESTSNPYETSGTALVCYAIMKAVNNGWLDAEYADAALLAFQGITTKKLDSTNTNLTDICFKGAPGSSNSTFYDNEGKGVGPFIMLYAEVVEYFGEEDDGSSGEEQLPATVTYEHLNGDEFIATGMGLTAVTAEVDESVNYDTIFDTYDPFAAYAISLDGYTEGDTVELTMSVSNVLADNLVIYKVNEDGSVTEITEFTAFAHPEFENVLNVTFDITSTGIYAVGTRLSAIPEGAVLTALEITQEPETVYYFVEEANEDGILPLNITGLEVQATYSNGTASVTKRIEWNNFDTTADAYALTCDMTVLGKQDVVVSYTYGDVTLTDTFGIEIVDRYIHDIDLPEVQLELTVPMPVTVEVVENTNDETVKAALETIFTTYVSYDFTLEGYNQGDEVKVTLPLPEGEGEGLVYYVPETGAPEQITNAVDNGDGTITFTTDHFSTYAVGRAAVTGTGNLVGGTVYELATSITAGEEYLIVSTNNGNGSALTNENGTATGTDVTVDDGQITLTENASNMLWTFSGTNNGRVSNNGRYVYPNNGNLSLNTNNTNNTNLTISNQNDGAYRIYRYNNNYYYYLRYNNDTWTGSRTRQQDSVGSVYLYVEKETVTGGEVVFTVTPEPSTTIMPNGTVALNTTVTVAGEKVTISADDIDWTIDQDGEYISIENGVVTGLKDGTATVTATLNSVNGKELADPIALDVEITVQSKEIQNVTISDNVGNVSRGAADRDTTGDVLHVIYEDGSEADIDITLSMLDGTYDTSKEDTYTGLKVNFNGFEFPYTLIVNPKAGNNYPDYPDPGAVKVNKTLGDLAKFQETGVVDIELSTSGIPVQTGIDAVLTIDISNSMAWATGTTSADGYADYNKLDEVMAAVKNFANILLAPDEDGSATNNTITIVTFAGFDADNSPNTGIIDSVRTLVTATSSVDVVEEIADGTYFSSADGITISYIPANQDQNDVDNVTRESGTNRGDTNYDYAFWQTNKAVIDGNLGGENREIHVLFMTDGCASNFNNTYYRTNNVGYYYQPGTTTVYNATTTYTTGTAWTNWITSSIESNDGNVYAKTLYNNVTNLYAIGFDMANGSFAGIGTWDTSVDWEETFNEIVGKSVTDGAGNPLIDVTAASDSATLNKFYSSLAQELRYAATEAYFVDQMGDSFNLQMTSFVMKLNEATDLVPTKLDPEPVIEVLNYNIYKASDVDGENVTADMVGQRYGTAAVVETVTFDDNFNTVGTNGTPKVTAAYSSVGGYTLPDGTVVAANTTNILVDDVIYAKNFYYNTTSSTKTITLANGATYDLPGETFYWNIGTINEIEWALHYYVYLEGSMEGGAPAGSYATNNYATLYYKNWLDNDAQQDTTSPSAGWEAANVSYAFYLVDQYGNPVVNQTTGQTGSFYNAVKVTQPVVFQEIMLNNLEEINTIEASSITILPEGYDLYDSTASYKVVILSEEGKGSWTIDYNDEKGQSSYVTGHYGSYASNEPRVTSDQDASGEDYNLHDDYDYTHTTVWFAVVWVPKALPDAVVIDYGLPVDISVLINDQFGDNGKLNGIGTIAEMNAALETAGTDEEGNKKIYTESPAAGFGTSEPLTYGNATVNGSKVTYTPSTMAMNGYDEFAYEVEYDYNQYDNNGNWEADLGTQYYYSDITVIPATTVYYEDSFVTTEDEDGTSTQNGITYKGYGAEWTTGGTEFVGVKQAEDRPGQYNLPSIDANNVYGYDGVYASTSQFSLGDAHKITVSGSNYGTAEFDFYGTGFDVISMTSADTGFITVEVLNPEGKTVKSYMVDTYYGYNYVDGEWVKVTDSGEALYQVPVIRVEGLEYGTKYTALITVGYAKPFDHVGDGSYDFYLDAVRIYNPAGFGDEVDSEIRDAYVQDKEGWPVVFEMRDQIIAAKDFDITVNNNGDGTTEAEGIIFIDQSSGTYTISDYTNYGPNNELYLAPGQAVAFELNLQDYIRAAVYEGDEVKTPARNIVADVQIGAKSVDETPVEVTLSNTFSSGTREFKTASSMNYSIRSYLDVGTDTTDGNNDSKTTLVFTNTGTEGIVSFTNIKIVFAENPYAVQTNSVFRMSRPTADTVLMMLNAQEEEIPEVEETEPEATEPEVTEPEVTEPEATEPEETEPEATEPEEVLDADLKVSIRSTSVKVGSTIVVMATTSSDVDALTVNGKEVSRYVESRITGKRTWTTTVKATEAGTMNIEVTAFSTEGEELETAVNTVEVQAKSAGIVQQIIGSIIGMLFR